jgi:replicative superfamily II helicase
MGLIVRCIGVDRHADEQIPDLTGAARDATALHALFADTFSATSIDIDLLVDARATAAGIRGALDETLGAAGSDDDVILTVAGHGTRDHRLVAHDTSSVFEAYDATTIPMADLAARFRDSRARTIICVLDCCFSGGASARVFAETPVSRDVPFAAFAMAGEGRVMITAARVDEEAYEHPVRRHGLLTDALIRVLTSAADPAIDVTAAMAEVLSSVRAEAMAIGCTQTPELIGHVSGGVTMPALRRGDRYRAAFPEWVRPVVGASIAELAAYGIPEPVLDAWSELYPAGLNALQQEALNTHGALSGESLLVIAPTSAGKTFIGELAAVRAMTEGRKAVFLLPYRALVNEKYDQFLTLYRVRLGLRVIRCTGDYVDQRTAFVRGKYDLAILTYEMFLALAVGNAGTLPRIGLVVLDEAQFIAEARRGINVELILTYLRTARTRGVSPQLLALSATIGALNHFDDWLGVRTLQSADRPVPLEFGVLDRSGVFQYLDAAGAPAVRQLLPRHAVQQRRAKPGSQDVIVPLVRQLLADPAAREKVLIFRNRRGPAEGCAEYLAAEGVLPPATAIQAALPTQDPTSASAALGRALAGGTALHNSDLSREERVAVERAFRDPDGPVRVLAATSGVAAGINTPASTVIIVEHGYPWENRDFTVGEVRNMAGRAGRQGYRETGRAILLAETPLEREQLFQRYVLAPPEPVRSSFQGSDLGTWVLRLFAQAKRVPEHEVPALIGNTYGGYLAARQDPRWPARTAETTAALVTRMLTLELLERVDDGALQLTLLGRACGQSSLTLESALRLVAAIRRTRLRPVTPEYLMGLVQALPELDQRYTPLAKGQAEAQWVRAAGQRFGEDLVRALQEQAGELPIFWRRAKRVCLLAAWVAGEPAAQIEQRFTLNPFQGVIGLGDISGTADTTRFHLRSAFEIAQVALPVDAPDGEAVDRLMRQLETGLPAHALGLLALPVPLTRGEALALVGAGLTTPADVWAAAPERLASLLGPTRARVLDGVRPRNARPGPDTAVA